MNSIYADMMKLEHIVWRDVRVPSQLLVGHAGMTQHPRVSGLWDGVYVLAWAFERAIWRACKDREGEEAWRRS